MVSRNRMNKNLTLQAIAHQSGSHMCLWDNTLGHQNDRKSLGLAAS